MPSKATPQLPALALEDRTHRRRKVKARAKDDLPRPHAEYAHEGFKAVEVGKTAATSEERLNALRQRVAEHVKKYDTALLAARSKKKASRSGKI